jgi:CRISPR-associated protein Csm2
LGSIVLEPIAEELFNEVARQAAETVSKNTRTNKATQLRRFYDELCMWESKVSRNTSKFAEYLPYIRMLNAKAAYAKGRGLVDENYTALLNHCLKQVRDSKTLRVCKLFFEAFMGFYKEVGPKN